MPKEFLDNILQTFSKITNILVDVAKIKETLELNPNNLENILEETKRQVETLNSHSLNIQEIFNKDYETVSKRVKEPAQGEQPRIKVIDINKLVNPRPEEKEEEKPEEPKEQTTSTKRHNSSVVFISSEEEDSELVAKKRNKKTSKNPTKPVLSRNLTETATTAKKNTNGLLESNKATEKLSETSPKNTEDCSPGNQSEIVKDDVKFRAKCYVKLERMPLEQVESDRNKELDTANICKSKTESSSDRQNNHNSTMSSRNKPKPGGRTQKTITEKKKDNKSQLNDTGQKDDDLDTTPDLFADASALQTTDVTNESDADTTIDLPEADSHEDVLTIDEGSDSKVDEIERGSKKPSTKPKKPISSEKSSTIDVEDLTDDNKDDSSSDSGGDSDSFCRTKKKIQEEVSRVMQKKLKRKILSDSDTDHKSNGASDKSDSDEQSSSSSTDKDAKKSKKGAGKKSRLRRMSDSSDDEDGGKSTRKQIRGILANSSLAETTKKAEAEERERKARIAEKQKKYNQVYEDNQKESAAVEKVVLDFDETTQSELLRVEEFLVSKLKPHQASGIQFMWDACFESLHRARKTAGSGCILAHCMGLGKTLQVITLAHTLLSNAEKTKVNKVLVVCPLNTVLNWVREFKQWLVQKEEFEVYELVSQKQIYQKLSAVKNWHEDGGVLIIGYDMFRNLTNPKNGRLSKRMRQDFATCLVDPGPDLVVCDEGHLLKNEKTNTSIAMNRLKTLRRIVLTGTPLQNNLKEYWCMVQFVKPNLLGTYKEYLNRFVNPITNGQYTDSTPHDIAVMRKRSHVLHKMLDGVVQRRDYAVLAPYLPPKYEYVLFLTLTETQINLYRYYLEHYARRSTGSNRMSFLFVDFQALQRICTHPKVLLDKSIEVRNKRSKEENSDEDSEGSLKDFIDDDDDESEAASTDESADDDKEEKEDNEGPKDRGRGRTRVTRAQAALARENGEEIPMEITDLEEPRAKEWWQTFCDGEDLNNIALSSKLFLLFEILKECEQIGDKVLVFSQSLYSLNIIEYFLRRISDATEEGSNETVNGYSGSWELGSDYFRLDGSSSCDNRSHWCQQFNEPSNTRARLFLISTRAGGLGINLVAANRVIIFDVSWNPSHDVQSIYRVYRFGQTKPCYIYRFVTQGTMEMKIYERQVTKQAISKRVIDEQQIDRHYNQNDLQELYKFDPKPPDRPIPLVPKDVLLGEILQKYEERVFKYHEHQSLLENKEDEGLNEEERKAAWEEFENEKIQRNTMGSSLMSAQNMQLAMRRILKMQNPNMDEVAVKQVIPQLFKEMQDQIKLGDLSLYTRVQHEIQKIHQENLQFRQQQLMQQHIMRAMQQQRPLFMPGVGYLPQNIPYMNGVPRAPMPGPSGSSNGVIDLND